MYDKIIITSMPSVNESKRSEQTVKNSLFIKAYLREGTSATFPSSPIILRRSSALFSSELLK